ncbi:hypothetical protein SAMN02745702_01850 [Desulfobaculum bizertense DSM 18034]|uniref:Uncharacterized protein n=1 Tax=Desulfobaculum bizertense DSM 18034 TaxID=1121442 RepID=A0A1T4W7X6_9BACT|nr:hypothetical protein SAMN02745702_01850 [Desulfobaculum bizertense DSM 18034]
MSESLWLSPSSGPFFRPSGVSRLRVLLPFSASPPFFLNASVQKENGGELAEEKDVLIAFSPKFKSRASEACTAFKLDEDT